MGHFKRVSVKEASQLINDGATVIDIRDENTYNEGHIPGASHYDRQALFDFIDEANPDQSYVLYCYKGNSSQMAAQMLADEGFGYVYSMDGGYQSWLAEFPDKTES